MSPIPKTLMDTITLNDGNKMPMFGLGTYLSPQNEVEKACLEAIKLGYRLIDTAMYYENEAGVGAAVRNCGLDRKEIFVTSKLHGRRHGAKEARAAVEQSLKELNIGYVDLYLIHMPIGGKILETYDVLLEYQKKGLVKSVGVSNFGVIHLKGLAEAGRQTPAVNQIELNCFWRLDEVVKYCRDHGIAVEGYSPMAKSRKNGDPTVAKIAKRLNIGYVDLYLIHMPIGGKILETYDVLLEYQKKGLVKSVGVSNFGVVHLKRLAEAGRQTPAVNQIELNCFWRLDEVVKYCRDHGIAVEGYSPMAKSRKNGDPTVAKIAKRLGKSPFQVMIRWSVQKGYITIPKSTNPDRIKQNADVFDWSLTDEEMAELDAKPESSCVEWDLMGNEWTP